jgi:hypothetical protein
MDNAIHGEDSCLNDQSSWTSSKIFPTSLSYQAYLHLPCRIFINRQDRHEAAVTALPNEVIEVSISPLNQFYIPIRTYHSSETDQQIAYFPDGNEKYAIYTIDTTNPDQPLLEVQLKIKGGTVWKHVFSGKKAGGNPTIEKGRTAIEKAWGWMERIAWQQHK